MEVTSRGWTFRRSHIQWGRHNRPAICIRVLPHNTASGGHELIAHTCITYRYKAVVLRNRKQQSEATGSNTKIKHCNFKYLSWIDLCCLLPNYFHCHGHHTATPFQQQQRLPGGSPWPPLLRTALMLTASITPSDAAAAFRLQPHTPRGNRPLAPPAAAGKGRPHAHCLTPSALQPHTPRGNRPLAPPAAAGKGRPHAHCLTPSALQPHTPEGQQPPWPPSLAPHRRGALLCCSDLIISG